MKKAKKTLKTKEEGITLIALVVTIIVLLILAGISIAMLTGEDGILNRAKEANEKTEIATEKEQRQLAMYEASMNLSGMTFQDVKIPAGFAPTRIAGESTVDEGLVIIDSEGNEFVWIPCTIDQYKKHTYEVSTIDDTEKNLSDGVQNDKGWNTYQYRKYSDWRDDEIDEEANKKSVEDNKGFYIARYEAGIPKEATSFFTEASNDGDKTYKVSRNNIEENLKPLSKRGVQAWNYIAQPNAKTVSERMYSGNNYGVRSQLVDGIAWDTVVEWIAKDSNYTNIAKDSTNYGNYYNTPLRYVTGLYAVHHITDSVDKYSYGTVKLGDGSSDVRGIEIATGLVDSFKLKNIYDMAGNMMEWTTERGCHNEPTSSQKFAVVRGGSAHDKGGINLDGAVSVRGGHLLAGTLVHDFVGFRVVLYLK